MVGSLVVMKGPGGLLASWMYSIVLIHVEGFSGHLEIYLDRCRQILEVTMPTGSEPASSIDCVAIRITTMRQDFME